MDVRTALHQEKQGSKLDVTVPETILRAGMDSPGNKNASTVSIRLRHLHLLGGRR